MVFPHATAMASFGNAIEQVKTHPSIELDIAYNSAIAKIDGDKGYGAKRNPNGLKLQVNDRGNGFVGEQHGSRKAGVGSREFLVQLPQQVKQQHRFSRSLGCGTSRGKIRMPVDLSCGNRRIVRIKTELPDPIQRKLCTIIRR